MARLVFGLVFGGAALAAIAGGYLLIASPPPHAPAAPKAAPPAIANGFVGVAKFGHWRLICAAEVSPPPRALAIHSAPANSCRINQEVAARDRPGQVIVAANLSVVGPQRRPALTLRLPATARDGDVVVLRNDGGGRARVTVHGCTPGECFAAGDLSDDEWDAIQHAKDLQVSFPATNRRPVLVDLPVDGLADAARAMETAQTVAP